MQAPEINDDDLTDGALIHSARRYTNLSNEPREANHFVYLEQHDSNKNGEGPSIDGRAKGERKELDICGRNQGGGVRFDATRTIDPPFPAHIEPSRFVCAFEGCEMRFMWASELQRHNSELHLHASRDEEIEADEDVTSIPYADLSKSKDAALESPTPDYQCYHEDCRRRFVRKTSLTNHLKAHQNIRSRSIYRTKRARIRAAAVMQARSDVVESITRARRQPNTNRYRSLQIATASQIGLAHTDLGHTAVSPQKVRVSGDSPLSSLAHPIASPHQYSQAEQPQGHADVCEDEAYQDEAIGEENMGSNEFLHDTNGKTEEVVHMADLVESQNPLPLTGTDRMLTSVEFATLMSDISGPESVSNWNWLEGESPGDCFSVLSLDPAGQSLKALQVEPEPMGLLMARPDRLSSVPFESQQVGSVLVDDSELFGDLSQYRYSFLDQNELAI